MPHLVGIWSPERSVEDIRSFVAKQLQQVRIPGAPGTDFMAVFPGFGMAFQDPGILKNGPQPASSEDGRYELLLDGEIWNAEELSGPISQSPAREKVPCPGTLPATAAMLWDRRSQHVQWYLLHRSL